MKTVHVIGAGLAGLAAAVRLSGAGAKVHVYESAPQAGGRCRSYHDATLGMEIDNGNHLVLSGNTAALDFVRSIGSADMLVGPPSAEFAFVDLASKERWTLRFNDGRIPWWVFSSRRRVPGTHVSDYASVAPLVWGSAGKTVADTIRCDGALYERLVAPLLIAALNTDPREGSATLAGAVVRNTLLAGGAACRPLVAHRGLGAAFVAPALQHLERRGATVELNRRLRALDFDGGRVAALDFADGKVAVGDDAAVVLAVPPVVAGDLLPGLDPPTEFRAIVNAHFRLPPAPGQPAILGLIHGTVEWVFAFPDRVSTTISAADRLLDTPREELARVIWADVSAATGLPAELPPWQIVRERRATFAATPAQDAKRPGPKTQWNNLVLAGDWTDTGLPGTIEGAIRSGDRAAEIVRTQR
jgi:squalene-associated FAD-dependent desaturase